MAPMHGDASGYVCTTLGSEALEVVGDGDGGDQERTYQRGGLTNIMDGILAPLLG